MIVGELHFRTARGENVQVFRRREYYRYRCAAETEADFASKLIRKWSAQLRVRDEMFK